MRIIWNGHSCFTLEAGGGTVVVDPYLDGSVPGLEPLRLKADAVYCSHGHRDHGGEEVVALTGGRPEIDVETLNGSLADLNDAIQQLSKLDIDTLNRAIANLNSTVEPLARFFGLG